MVGAGRAPGDSVEVEDWLSFQPEASVGEGKKDFAEVRGNGNTW